MSSPKRNTSVVVLTYNSEKHIGRCLQSVLSESERIIEVIVVDNHSQDGTVEIVKRHKNIKLISNIRNLGFSKGVNMGIKQAKGSKVLILNPDTTIISGSVDKLINCQTHFSAGIAGGKLQKNAGGVHNSFVKTPDLLTGIFDFTNLRKITPFDFIHKRHYYLHDKYPNRGIEVDAVSGAYMLVNREVFERIGLFDEKFFMYLEDVDFCIRAKQLGFKVVFCPKSVIFHEGGASSKNADKINHNAWSNSRRYYFGKHFSKVVNMMIQPIFVLDDITTTLWRKLKLR